MDKQIDGRLTERDVVRRVIVSPECGGIHAERMRGMLHIAGGQHQPCLDEILFDYDAVGPSPVGRPGVRGGVDELAINDRPRQYPAHMPWATKDKDRRSGGDQAFALFHDKPQLVQEVDIGQRLMPAGVAFVEHAPVPTHGFRVEELLGIQP